LFELKSVCILGLLLARYDIVIYLYYYKK
jgi:hypothetical protein